MVTISQQQTTNLRDLNSEYARLGVLARSNILPLLGISAALSVVTGSINSGTAAGQQWSTAAYGMELAAYRLQDALLGALLPAVEGVTPVVAAALESIANVIEDPTGAGLQDYAITTGVAGAGALAASSRARGLAGRGIAAGAGAVFVSPTVAGAATAIVSPAIAANVAAAAVSEYQREELGLPIPSGGGRSGLGLAFRPQGEPELPPVEERPVALDLSPTGVAGTGTGSEEGRLTLEEAQRAIRNQSYPDAFSRPGARGSGESVANDRPITNVYLQGYTAPELIAFIQELVDQGAIQGVSP